MIAFVAMLAANEWLFTRLEFVPGINWIYLPAGMRLLCVLLFGNAGAIGLLLVSWLVCFFYFFPDDYLRSFMGGVLASRRALDRQPHRAAGVRPARFADQPVARPPAGLHRAVFDRQSAAAPYLVRRAWRDRGPAAQLSS